MMARQVTHWPRKSKVYCSLSEPLLANGRSSQTLIKSRASVTKQLLELGLLSMTKLILDFRQNPMVRNVDSSHG